MKRIILFILCVIFLTILPLTVYAADNGGDSSVSITVVIPQTEPTTNEPLIPTTSAPEPTTQKPVRYLYPVSVKESQDENGRREIIKTYELAANEKPDNISRESFTRDGWLYELADITKKETDSTDTRKHTETITVNTDTNDTNKILNQLALTIDYKATDGYAGVLSLDIASIKVETAGTQSSSYTVTATREYPNLSSNDTSLVPKSITENGRTLTLSTVDWRVQNYVTIDYDRIPDSYTAVVTYTGTAYKTVVTGYITTAEYNGTLSKNITGKTVYKASFIGIPIVITIETEPETEVITEPIEITTEPEPETTSIFDNPNYIINIMPITENTEESKSDELTESNTGLEQPRKNSFDLIPVLIYILIGIGFGCILMYLYIKEYKKSKTKQEENKLHENK